MNLQSARKSQVETAIKNIKEGIKNFQNEEVEKIKEFYLMSMIYRIELVEDYIQDLEVDPEVEKLKTDYKKMKSEYQSLKKKYNNLIKRL